MKKMLSFIFAVVMMFALVTNANAAISSGSGSEGQDVKIEVIQRNDSEVIYSVDISWPNLNFTYNQGTGTWNPGTHAYDQSGQSWVTTAHHSAVTVAGKPGLKSSDITVTNHSNADIWYNAAYNPDGTTVEGVTVGLTGSTQNIKLNSGETVIAANAAKDAFQVQVYGIPTATVLDSTKTGTVTVTISHTDPSQP